LILNQNIVTNKLNVMRQILSVVCVFILISVSVNAQPPRGQYNPEDMAKRQTEQMKADLELSDEQVKTVGVINDKYSKKMGEAFQQSAGNREQMRETMQKMRSEKNEELKEVLTAEQFDKHKKIEEQRMQEFRQRRGDGADRQGGRGAQRGMQRGGER
jgi:hypothetical protein